MDSNQFREAAHAAIDEIINYYETLPTRPVLPTISPGYLAPQLPSSPPLNPEPWNTIQPDLSSKILPGLTHWQSPNFMAFFPATSTYPGMLGELYSAAFTAPAFNWICSPAITELETVVLDWVAQMLGLPECFLSTSEGGGGGVIQGSASEAMVVVVVAARERYLRHITKDLPEGSPEKENKLSEVRSKLVVLGSDQSHSCAQKASMIAGTRYREVPCRLDDNLEMRGESVRTVIEQCRKEGLHPFFLNSMLGSTATCAVDRFGEIKDVMQSYPEIWMHVDAAYAGAALVCPEYQHLVQHLGSFDSFDMNMHKWLLTNFDASCLFIKNRTHLTTALSITPPYLQNRFSTSGLVTDYRDWQIPLGRRFRSLKIWFVIRTYGVSGLQNHIRRTVGLGEYFAGLVRGRGDLFGIVTRPGFALTVLRVVGTGGEGKGGEPEVERSNRFTKKVYEAVSARGEAFLTSSVVDGLKVIRVVSANERAEEKYLKRVFEVLVEVTEGVLRGEDKGQGERLRN
ncbi:MAG: hypothetical protein M1834_001010 [Cirrosporium novae-zelandiae]|nr:MAG: hypothetical protein M1834_001010 [Cirrosporium novae-zelandiae]